MRDELEGHVHVSDDLDSLLQARAARAFGLGLSIFGSATRAAARGSLLRAQGRACEERIRVARGREWWPCRECARPPLARP